MLTADQCQTLASKYKSMARGPDVSEAQIVILKNIARSLTGLATQLDRLTVQIREDNVQARQR